MNVESCRILLSDAWLGVTAHNTHWICDPDYVMDNFSDEEILTWVGKLVAGSAKLGYNITADGELIPSLMD